MSHYASVVMHADDPATISNAVIDVFEENGFQLLDAAPRKITFYKPGNTSTQIVWGNLANSNPIWVQPEVTFAPRSRGNAWDVRCDVSIRQSNSTFGVDEKKPFLTGRIPYTDMLNKAKKRVEGR